MQVKYASICGTDQHIFKGELHPRTHGPMIPGHEFAGVITEVGNASKKYQPSDWVAVDPLIWCGKCAACQIQHFPACTSLKLLGVDMEGGFGEFVVADETMLSAHAADS